MSFSSEDIASMDREVEDIFNETESEGEPDKTVSQQDEENEVQVQTVESANESSSSSAETLSGENATGVESNANNSPMCNVQSNY